MITLKNFTLTLILLVLTVFLGWFIYASTTQQSYEVNAQTQAGKPTLALVISKTGDAADIGQAVEHGVRHYLKEWQGQTKQSPLGLAIYDDASSADTAKSIAQQIVANPDIIAVIGHSANHTTLAAAPIYQQAGIPMLTPTADDYRITNAKNLAFSVRMNNQQQGQFLALYIQHTLEAHKVTLINDGTLQQDALLQTLRTDPAKYNVELHDINLTPNTSTAWLATLQTQQPELLILATNAATTKDLLIQLKDHGLHQPIIAIGPVGTPTFAKQFAHLPKEQSALGYYTNGVIVPVPFILDIANAIAQQQNTAYHDHFGHDIAWPFAYGYDAAKIMITAFQPNPETPKLDKNTLRKTIQQALTQMNHAATGINGITGISFFNAQGSGEHPPMFASFQNRTLISHLNQFTVTNVLLEHYDPLQHTTHINVDNEMFGLADIVYTGIKINQLENISLEKRSFAADFDLWFRYHGDFDPANIQFQHVLDNQITIKDLGQQQLGTVKYKRINVKASFTFHLKASDFLLHKFDLLIAFRSKLMNRNELIYVVDRTAFNTFKFNKSLLQQMLEERAIPEQEDKVLEIATQFETIHTQRAYGNPQMLDGHLPFSQFNVELVMHPKSLSIPRMLGKLLNHELEISLALFATILLVITFYPAIQSKLGRGNTLLRYFALACLLINVEILTFTEEANRFDFDLTQLHLIDQLISSTWFIYIALFSRMLLTLWLWPSLERKRSF